MYYRIKLTILSLLFASLLVGCKDYLNVPPDATKSEKDIFSNYYMFESFVDNLYQYVADPFSFNVGSPNWGGEAFSNASNDYANIALRGDYTTFSQICYFGSTSSGTSSGLWPLSWMGIRQVNLALSNFKLLNASEEEKNLIKGQLHFFRAYYHYQVLSAWGSIPYIDTVITREALTLPRYYEYKGKKNYQACTEYIVEDFDKAAALLPIAWSNPTNNLGRVTKLAALAYKAEALLYAASPLMNEASGNTAIPDLELMKRAAEAAGEAIKIAEDNPDIYGLVSKAEYQTNYASMDKSMVWTKEIIFNRTPPSYEGSAYDFGAPAYSRMGSWCIPENDIYGGARYQNTVTQNFVDYFEMADGSLYKPEYDKDNARRWDDRDPRFRMAIYVDRDYGSDARSDRTRMDLYPGGKSKIGNGGVGVTSYIIHKYWPNKATINATTSSVNNTATRSGFRYRTPLMRLAEVYLNYAEAQNEVSGAGTTAAGATLTALDAVNKVRSRVGMPAAKIDGYPYRSFREQVLNERNVELCFETKYWYDIRRWKIAEKLDGQPMYDLEFDKNWTPSSFTRKVIPFTLTFKKRQYWLPFRQQYTQLYPGFPQNPGWD
jgi:hypothetical protein